MIIPLTASEGIAAVIPINWDDPLAVGCQQSAMHGGPWCHRCDTGNHRSRLPFLGLLLSLDVCWWCGGAMQPGKPTRTAQETDRTIAETRLEPARPERDAWVDDVWGYHDDAA